MRRYISLIDEQISVVKYIHQIMIDGFKIRETIYACPYCGEKLIPMEDRCPKCEQKLKW